MKLSSKIITSILVLGLAFVMGVFTVQTYYMLIPTSWYFEYYDVRPVNDQFEVGNDLYFIADHEVKRVSHLFYFDNLICDMGDGVFMHQYGRKKEDPHREPMKRTEIRFRFPNMMSEAAECYLQSDVMIRFPYFVERVQPMDQIYKFQIVEDESGN